MSRTAPRGSSPQGNVCPGNGQAEEALQAAHRQLAAAGAVGLLTVPIGDPAGLESWWRRLNVADRRAVITTLIRKLTIAPGRPGRGFDPARIRITYAS